MTMHIHFPEYLENRIKEQVTKGGYANASEFIREAVRDLLEKQTRVAEFKAAVAEGIEELDRGEGIPYTHELMDHIEKEAIQNMHNGEPHDPNVCG